MDVEQYRDYIIRYTLYHLGLHSSEAEELVLGTVLQESGGLKYIRQLGGGPAMGFIQMETATHDDIWENFLRYRSHLAMLVRTVSGFDDYSPNYKPNALNLMGNMVYGVAMCRVHYFRQPGALPSTLSGQALYWKRYYNTRLGKGTVKEYVDNWRRYAP